MAGWRCDRRLLGLLEECAVAEDEEKDEVTEEPDDSEEKFFQRVKAMQKDALNEWAAELSAEIDEEEEKAPAKPAEKVKVAFEARKKPPKQEEPKQDEAEEDDEPEPTAAERSREAGRRGPGRPSGYWPRVRPWIYGRNR